MERIRAFFRTLLSLNGTPLGIATGFTLGLSLSLIPIPFAGMLAALALAPVLRANLPATYLGTAVVNPATAAFFYFCELWVGLTVLGRTPPTWSTLRSLDTRGWLDLAVTMIGPFALGGTIAVVVTGVTVFPIIYWIAGRVRRPHRAPHDDPTPPTKKGDAELAPPPLTAKSSATPRVVDDA